MCIYDVLAITFMLFAAFEYHRRMPEEQSRKLFYFASSLLLFVMCFKSADTGEGMGDLQHYVNLYLGKGSMYDSDEVEPGLKWIISILHFLPSSEFLYIATTSLLIICPVLWGINKYSGNRILSLVLILVLQGVWLVEFIAMRQALAQSIVLVAIYIILNREYIKQWKVWVMGLCILSTFFHSTSYIIIPISIVAFFIPNNKLYLYITLGVSLALSTAVAEFLANTFLMYFGGIEEVSRITYYIENDIYGSNGFSILNYAPLTLLVAAIVYYSDSNDDNNYFVKSFVIGMVIYNLLGEIPLINRAVCFSFILGLIGSISTIKTNRQFLVLFVMIAYFVWRESVHYSLSPHSAFLPYHFIWE